MHCPPQPLHFPSTAATQVVVAVVGEPPIDGSSVDVVDDDCNKTDFHSFSDNIKSIKFMADIKADIALAEAHQGDLMFRTKAC